MYTRTKDQKISKNDSNTSLLFKTFKNGVLNRSFINQANEKNESDVLNMFGEE